MHLIKKAIVAVDAMGGDYGPTVTLPASLKALSLYPNLHLVLVGDEHVLKKILETERYDKTRLSIHHASQVVGMDESPALALRGKKDSSMRVAINLIKEGQVGACVSAGNTGALMATAKFVLKTLPGIDRPAIVSAFPCYQSEKKVRILDLGANVDSRPEDLLQFTVMGSVLTKAVDNIDSPKVYLLNIGEEEIKGNEQVKTTARMLCQVPTIHFQGYIEADSIYYGDADVIVCDGFVGNVTLKTTEGVARLIGQLMKDAFMRNWWTKFVGMLVKPVLKTFMKRIDPGRYNGASFIGLNGIVIKSHGGANLLGFVRAIEEAMIQIEKNIPELIRHEVSVLLKTLPTQNE